MEIRTLCEIIGNISSLSSCIIEENKKQIITTSTEAKEIVDLITSKNLSFSLGNNSIAVYTTKENLNFIIYSESKTQYAIFGPFVYTALPLKKDIVIDEIEKLQNTTFGDYKSERILFSIPVKDKEFVIAWKELIEILTNNKFETFAMLKEENNSDKDLSIPSIARHDESDIDQNYDFESQIRSLVIEGNKEALKQMLIPTKNRSRTKIEGDFGSNILPRLDTVNKSATERRFLTILNTLMRIAAESAGLPPVYLHSLSNNIASLIDKYSATDDPSIILSKMISEYCDAINISKISNHSYRIARVQKYIISHLTDNLSLFVLAEVASTTEQYLSKLFKTECGMTITEYIRKLRINEAKSMLKNTSLTLNEISTNLDFSSQNYFTLVFQKETGMSPSEYRLRITKDPLFS